MGKYRKKPVVIDAIQWTGTNVLEVYSFIHGAPTLDSSAARDRWDDFCGLHWNKEWHVKTLEDGAAGEVKHVASVGDWIIKGVQGEFYPCKPDIFAATYEPASTPHVTGIELPASSTEPIEIIWPEYHYSGMGCGLEDWGIHDRYDAMRYGWDCAVERCAEAIPDGPLYTAPPVVGVKELEWTETIMNGCTTVKAETPFGSYAIFVINDTGNATAMCHPSGPWKENGTKESLTRVAQADYENRIRSALVSFIGTSIDNPIEPPKN